MAAPPQPRPAGGAGRTSRNARKVGGLNLVFPPLSHRKARLLVYVNLLTCAESIQLCCLVVCSSILSSVEHALWMVFIDKLPYLAKLLVCGADVINNFGFVTPVSLR